MRALLLLLLVMPLCAASSCEEKLDDQLGIKVVPDPANPNHFIVTQDPNKGNVGKTLTVANDATAGIPIAHQVTGGLLLVGNLLSAWLLSRAKARAAELNAKADAAAGIVDTHEAAHDATNTGLQTFLHSQPVEIGLALIKALDQAHDAAGIPGAIQDAIQPVLKS